MSTFAVENYEPIYGEKLTFYKLSVDNVFLIDEFENNLTARERKWFNNILACMEDMANYDRLLPNTKFKNIKGINRDNVFEFKKEQLRVYVLKKSPDVIIIFGGHKENQKKEIKRLSHIVNELKMEELL